MNSLSGHAGEVTAVALTPALKNAASAGRDGTIRLWDDLDQGENILQKIIYTASKPNIARVWIGGREVSRSPDLKGDL